MPKVKKGFYVPTAQEEKSWNDKTKEKTGNASAWAKNFIKRAFLERYQTSLTEKQGGNIIRIFPSLVSGHPYVLALPMHKGGPDNKDFICTRKFAEDYYQQLEDLGIIEDEHYVVEYGGEEFRWHVDECPYCDQATSNLKDLPPNSLKLWKQRVLPYLTKKTSPVLFMCLDYTLKEDQFFELNPMIRRVPPDDCWLNIIALSNDPEGGADISLVDPEAGYKIFYEYTKKRTGQGADAFTETNYFGFKLSRDIAPLPQEFIDKASEMETIFEVLQFIPPEKLLKWLPAVKEDEDEEKPFGRQTTEEKGLGRKTRRSEPDDEEQNNDNEGPDDEGQEDEQQSPEENNDGQFEVKPKRTARNEDSEDSEEKESAPRQQPIERESKSDKRDSLKNALSKLNRKGK